MYKLFFDFKNFFTYVNYFRFIECYLKLNNILKKDFLGEIGLNPGTYRNFLKKPEKNEKEFYEIVSNKMGMTLPSEEKIEQLNKEFSKWFYDILYLKFDNLKATAETLKKIQINSITSLEQLPILLIKNLIDVTLNYHLYNFKIKQWDIALLEPFASMFAGDLEIIYLITKYSIDSLKPNATCAISVDKIKSLCVKNKILEGYALDIISTCMLYKEDYLHALLYASDAYESLIKQSNFIRTINIKIRQAIIYFLVDDLMESQKIFIDLSFLSEMLTPISYCNIQNGLMAYSIVASKLDFATMLYNQYDFSIYTNDIFKIFYLYVCYKKNLSEAYDKIYQHLIQKWKANELDDSYFYIVETIDAIKMKNINKPMIKKAIGLSMLLKDKMAKKVFCYIFQNIKME